MKIRNVIGTLAAAVFLVGLGSPAQATESDPSAPPSPQEIDAEIDAIEVPAIRESTEALYTDLVAQGHEILSLSSVGFEPAEGQTSARAYPTDCGMSVFVSRANQIIYNNTVTSCNASFSSVQHNLGIKGENPYNPFDQKTVKNVSYTAYNKASVTHSTSYACQNSNQTYWYAISNGTLVRNGVTYYTPSSVYDVTAQVACGW